MPDINARTTGSWLGDFLLSLPGKIDNKVVSNVTPASERNGLVNYLLHSAQNNPEAIPALSTMAFAFPAIKHELDKSEEDRSMFRNVGSAAGIGLLGGLLSQYGINQFSMPSVKASELSGK